LSDLERQVGVTSRLTREGSFRGRYAADQIFGRENENSVHSFDGARISADEMGDVVGDVKTLTATKQVKPVEGKGIGKNTKIRMDDSTGESEDVPAGPKMKHARQVFERDELKHKKRRNAKNHPGPASREVVDDEADDR
jgi:hypothetical protein